MRGLAKRTLIDRAVRAEATAAEETARAIHSYAEPPMQEVRSAEVLAGYLSEHGFRVDFAWKQLPTAFRATRGRRRPAVGLLGEYDALPDCGKKEGEWGHGCGHNLLGVASAVAAVAASEVLTAKGVGGKIIYYGCPAEELLHGKVYMARDGAFRDMDACLAWHPGAKTGVCAYGGNALDSVIYEFFGKTSHAAAGPDLGRSALDAAILFDVSANYLREHVPEAVRLHSVIRSGGDAPNVVPAYSRIWFYVRAPKRDAVDGVRRRLDACARAAATATGTEVKITRITALYERLPNEMIHQALLRNVKLFGPPRPAARDKRDARKAGIKGDFNTKVTEGLGAQGRASSDEDTVSWLVPLGRFNMVTSCGGAQGHHRETTRLSALPFAVKGMLQAAKVLAGTAFDLCADTALLRQIRNEFRKRTKGSRFTSLIPKRQRVPTEAP